MPQWPILGGGISGTKKKKVPVYSSAQRAAHAFYSQTSLKEEAGARRNQKRRVTQKKPQLGGVWSFVRGSTLLSWEDEGGGSYDLKPQTQKGIHGSGGVCPARRTGGENAKRESTRTFSRYGVRGKSKFREVPGASFAAKPRFPVKFSRS